MKLSVIIPVYNAANFIEKSYQSIIEQGIEDFEIIYVDNNSMDRSLEIIKALSKKDSRIRYFIQSKPGSAPTRNKGLENAKGKYLYFFDVDDEIFPKALKKMIEVLDTYPGTDAVFGKMIKSNKVVSEINIPNDQSDEVIFKEKPYWGLYWFNNLSAVVGPPAFLYRRNVFDRIGKYNEDLKIGQDTALDIKLGMTSNVAFLDTYVYLYYKHGESTTDQKKKNTKRVFFQWPRLVKEHLPFYLAYDVPKEFKVSLFYKIYNSLGKQIAHTRGIKNRNRLRKKLLEDVKSISVPFLIKFYLIILVLFPFKIMIKFYSYYLMPYIKKGIE